MSWRNSQADSRARHLARIDAAEAARMDAAVGRLDAEDEEAYLADLVSAIDLHSGLAVLDAGAGGGALCCVLRHVPGLSLTALEPVPALLDLLRSKTGLETVRTVEGYCDSRDDRPLFQAAAFDVIVSRQLVNGLYDPLAAFENWHHWLRPAGAVAVIDGLYGRDAWAGAWQEEVDRLPLAAIQGRAAIPYLLERAGFVVEGVHWMERVNRRPVTRTPRYLTVARKP